MTPLPAALGGSELVAWRIDTARFAASWDSGQGSFVAGARWNSPGLRAVYCSLDPATAIMEVAVHIGFDVLDTVPHVLTSVTIAEPQSVHVVEPADVPNPNWLVPGIESAGQRQFGTSLLTAHKFVLIPSAVSSHSWNLIFVAAMAADAYALKHQERLRIDTRLNPAAPSIR
jgi:RES domain-containing protein